MFTEATSRLNLSESFATTSMKHLLTITLFCFGFLAAFGQSSTFTVSSERTNVSEIELEFSLGDYQLNTIAIKGKTYLLPVAEDAARLLVKGAPDLPQFSSSVMLTDAGAVRLEIVDVSFDEIQNVEIAPSPGNLKRSNTAVERLEGIQYTQKAFYPSAAASLSDAYIFRNARGAAVHVYPMQYNAVSKVLRINRSVRVKVVTDAATAGINERNPSRSSEAAWADAEMYERHFINYTDSRYETPVQWGKMLIISHEPFMAAMEDFITWKRRNGIPVEIISYSDLGSETAISNKIREEYYTNGLRYVLLVGDIEHIPSPVKSGGKSDPSYGYIEGNDAYPEVIIGRFSAETEQDVSTQVQRVLNYEQATSGDHFAKGIGIASQEGPGDDNEMDYEHVQNMNADLLNYTYTASAEFYEGSQAGTDAPGDPSAQDVRNAVDAGAGLLLYTGHGSSQSFGTSGFSNSTIGTLSNNGMLPLIWSVACVNGEFDNGTCFAEAWMRHTHNGEPAGAATVLMSSINQSWDPPMCAQDEMVDVLTGQIPGNSVRTFGAISISGCMKMNDEYGSAGDEMTDTWHIFGDPSLLVRTMAPLSMTVSHSESVPLGIVQLPVSVDVEGARVGLVQNGILISSGIVLDGLCMLEFDALSSPLQLEITVTASNYIPYQGLIDVIVPDGAYLIYEANQVNDINGNNNQQADYNESFYLDITAKNVGNQTPGPLTGVLSENSPWIAINAPTTCVFYPTENPLNYSTADCFSLQVADGVPDGTVVQLTLELTSESGGQWSMLIPIVIHAPEITVPTYEFVELAGNGNGRADAGEQFRIRIPNQNLGSASTTGGVASLTHSASSLETLNEDLYPQSVEAGATVWAVFDYQIPANFAVPGSISFVYSVMFGAYDANRSFTLPVGESVEDFENGLPENLWLSGADMPWAEDTLEVYEGLVSMKSGAIWNNEKSDLVLNGNVLEADELAFYFKVSSEEGYDFLRFYVDDVLQNSWSGLQGWQQASFTVSPGYHIFRWTYEKDEIIAANEDAAWVDFVNLPQMEESSQDIFTPQNHSIKVFPNPAASEVFISGVAEGKFSLRLMDVSGRILEETRIISTNNMLQWQFNSEHIAGLYFIQLMHDDGVISTSKLIKK